MILTVTMNPSVDTYYRVPDFALSKVHRAEKTIMTAGGKGLNVARVAKLLGSEVGATGVLGGSRGAFIRKGLQELGIADYFSHIGGESRICLNIVDPVVGNAGTAGNSTEILEQGPEVSEKEYANFLQSFRRLVTGCEPAGSAYGEQRAPSCKPKVITISGSLPQGISTECYKELIEIANQEQIPVLLDTSGKPLCKGIDAKPYLIKPNEDEIDALFELGENCCKSSICTDGANQPLLDVLAELRKQGIAIPIISMGKNGSLAGLEDGVYLVKTPQIDVVNTVGSGDSYIAGCAVGLSKGYDPLDVLVLATACGTVNALYEHTGYVTAGEVEDIKQRITYEKISSW